MSGKTKTLLGALVVLVLCLPACAVKQPEPVVPPVSDAELKAELVGQNWVAEYILGQPVIDMSHSNMVFSANDEVRGNGGCNSYGGKYTLKDGSISFGPMASTMRSCGKALDDQEMRFFQSLTEPLAVSFEHGILYLTPAEGQPSRFAVQN